MDVAVSLPLVSSLQKLGRLEWRRANHSFTTVSTRLLPAMSTWLGNHCTTAVLPVILSLDSRFWYARFRSIGALPQMVDQESINKTTFPHVNEIFWEPPPWLPLVHRHCFQELLTAMEPSKFMLRNYHLYLLVTGIMSINIYAEPVVFTI